MKKWWKVGLLVLALCSCGKPVPDGIDSQDRPFYWSDYQDKCLVVHYWAAWCQTCVNEFPELEKFANEYVGRVAVIGVNFDGMPAAELNTFASQHRVRFPLFSQLSLKKWGITQIFQTVPVTLFIVKDQLLKVVYMPQSEDSLVEALQLASDHPLC